MTNICTKVTVRKRPIKNGQVSLYLDKYSEVLSTFLETHQFHLNYGNSRLIFLYLLSVYIK